MEAGEKSRARYLEREERCLRKIPEDGKPCRYYIKGNEGEPGFCRLPDYFRCIEAVAVYYPRLSHSSIQSWLRCPFKYYLEQIRGLRLVPKFSSIPLRLGTIWDDIMNIIMETGAEAPGDYDIPVIDRALQDKAEKLEIDERDIWKIYAIVKAMNMLGVKVPKATPQHEIVIADPEVHILGKLDGVAYPVFYENKFTGSPDWYGDIFNIHDQIGTYFLIDPDLEKAVVRTVRNPQLKSVGKYKDESPEAYGKRIYFDIIGRPSFYFNKFNRTERTWGAGYYRSEFDLTELYNRVSVIGREIMRAKKEGGFYQRRQGCNFPGECEFKSICRTGGIPENKFTIRKE